MIQKIAACGLMTGPANNPKAELNSTPKRGTIAPTLNQSRLLGMSIADPLRTWIGHLLRLFLSCQATG
jgi:hypothetical protein